MAFKHLYSRDQQQAAIETLCSAEGCDGDQPPASLAWSHGRRAGALRDRWPSLDLEERVSLIAVQQGRFVPGDVSNPHHVITHGYEALCRTGSLCPPECAN